MPALPPKLQEYLDDFAFVTTREERVDYLVSIADEFQPVPPAIASQPYDEAHRVIGCESEAFVWAIDRPDGRLDYHFDVLNPQGLSAMAMCAILEQTCSGAPLEQVANITGEVVFTFFGRDVSMGKGVGLTELVHTVVFHARQRMQRAS